jgi:hypothetical protein
MVNELTLIWAKSESNRATAIGYGAENAAYCRLWHTAKNDFVQMIHMIADVTKNNVGCAYHTVHLQPFVFVILPYS